MIEFYILKNILSLNSNDTCKSLCQSCGSSQQKTLNRKIISTSKYILIHLNRFMIADGELRKNSACIHPTSIEININNHQLQYRVAGAIAHYGGISNGHYTYFHYYEAYWLEISDSKIDKRPPPTNGYIMLLELERNLG